MDETVNSDTIRENLLSIGFKESLYDTYIVNSKDNTCILSNLPSKYGPFPNFPKIPSYGNFYPATQDVILMYFQGIVLNLSVIAIEGIKPTMSSTSTRRCNYCDINIKNKSDVNGCKTCDDKSYYYCQECHKTMCPLCHDETTIETAINHKVNMSKFILRQPLILECLQHKLSYIPASSQVTSCYCDCCDNSINLLRPENCINEQINLYNFDKENIKWYQNRKEDMDICLQCSDTEDGIQTINEYNLNVMPYIPISKHIQFGSFLDWVPIFVTATSDFMLCNLNVESKYYLYVAYCHNYNGFYIFVLPERYKLISEMELDKFATKLSQSYDFNQILDTFNIQNARYLLDAMGGYY